MTGQIVTGYNGNGPYKPDKIIASVYDEDNNYLKVGLYGDTLEDTNLDSVESTGAGDDIDVSNYNKITVSFNASSVTDGGTIKVQGSMEGTDYYDIHTEEISSDGTTYTSISEKHKYIRTNLTSRDDGTYTTKIIAGN